MKPLLARSSAAIAILLLFAAASIQAQSSPPEVGRWITQSGNLEIDIAPCGAAFCGNIVRVIANGTMGRATGQAAAPPPLGKKILFDLQPGGSGGLQGQIHNRADGKNYNTLVKLDGPDQLELTIYQDTPAKGIVQIWRRAGGSQ